MSQKKEEAPPSIGWLDVKGAAKYLSIGTTKIREIFRREDFPVHWVGNKQFVKVEDLDRYITEGRAS